MYIIILINKRIVILARIESKDSCETIKGYFLENNIVLFYCRHIIFLVSSYNYYTFDK